MIQHPLAPGTPVRTKNDNTVCIVEFHVTADEAVSGGAFYSVIRPGGEFMDYDEADIVEVVAATQEAADDRLPTKEQVHRLLALLCGEETDDLSIDETEIDEDYVTLYGETELGSAFSVEVRISAILPEDF